jgi:hypothetical protein
MPYGAQLKFGMARQAAVGSGNAVTAPTSFHHIALLSEDVGLDKDEIVSANLTGRFEQGAVYDGVNRINGTLDFEVTPKSVGALLMMTLGPTTGVTSGSLRTYTFLPRSQDYSAQLCNEPVTVYKQFSDSNSAEHYFDCQLSQLEFQFSQGALLRGRAVVAAGARVATGIGSLNLPLDTGDLSLGFLWDATSISYGGSGIGAQSDITVSINENIDALYTLNGTLSPYKYTRTGFREVTVNGTMYFDSRSAYNDFISGTQRRLIITAQARKTQIQSGYFATLEIDVPQLKITQFKPGASGPSEVSASFTGRGVVDPSSAYAIRATLINTYAAGY